MYYLILQESLNLLSKKKNVFLNKEYKNYNTSIKKELLKKVGNVKKNKIKKINSKKWFILKQNLFLITNNITICSYLNYIIVIYNYFLILENLTLKKKKKNFTNFFLKKIINKKFTFFFL